MKQLLARTLAACIKDGDTIGIGSGTTVELGLEYIGKRIAKEGIRVSGVPTSHRVASIAADLGIQLLSPVTKVDLAWAFDGADEVDPAFNMIKGRGAAMLNEKIIAKRAEELVIIISEEKLVDKLGTKHPIPVEIVAEATQLATDGLKGLGATKTELRPGGNKYGPLVTEHGNLVIDAWFDNIEPALEREIKSLTGVVESGLFIDCATELLVARNDGVWSRKLVDGTLVEGIVLKKPL